MNLAAGFLGTAKGRLLPPSLPFRFFAAACVAHALGWLAVLAGAEQATRFTGGLGLPLAALHLMTLGVMMTTAIGASLQLLPVATRAPLAPPGALSTLWWLVVPGVAVTTAGMAWAQPHWLGAGALVLVLALLGYAVLLARSLAAARGMGVMVAHAWVALGALLLLLASGLSLALDYSGRGLDEHGAALQLHLALALYGVMGMLVMGLSHVLVPMFVVGDAAPARPAYLSVAGAVLALLLQVGSAASGAAAAAAAACACGLAALGLHLWLMRAALRSGMRRWAGPSVVLVRLGWALLAAGLLAALALALQGDSPWPALRTLAVVLALGGLLSLLFGMLSRIVPFLASMHAAPGRRGAPPPSALSADGALAWHLRAHVAALALLLAAVVADSPWLARAAGAAGLVAAAAIGHFVAEAWRRLRAPARV